MLQQTGGVALPRGLMSAAFDGQEETLPKIELRGVTERDIDLLLLEELVASPDFREWFRSQVGIDTPQSLDQVARSVVTSTGESDLEVTFCHEGCITRILVENKIDAVLQPRQAERYAVRAQDYFSRGECHRVLTLVIAPQSYVASVRGFDRALTYEALREWFANAATGDQRGFYKLALLEAAISRGNSGWKMVPDPGATDFWINYWKLACAFAPELNMPRPGAKPATSSFIHFKPHELRKGVTLVHKVPYGNVDLQFSGQAENLSEFAVRFERTLEDGMTIARANKSLAVRTVVDPISLESRFSEIEGKIQLALKAARRLLSWYGKHSTQLPSINALNPTGSPVG
jgi:hypothetical protein